MKPHRAALVLFLISGLVLSGCATTDREMTQKEKDKIDREMQKANRQNAQEQSKAMRSMSGQTRQPR
ncbi:MAG: hypothetical protein ABIQ12_13365 [Opitutaceae bacterium]